MSQNEHTSIGADFEQTRAQLDARHADYVVNLVDMILREAQRAGASDVHLQPSANGLDMRWRIDGVLHHVSRLPVEHAAPVVARLKVMADLLTYRTDSPQEGRIRDIGRGAERRVSTFPTLFGEKAVVRLFADPHAYRLLADLGLPADVSQQLEALLRETSGAIVIAGPDGSGKTTTLYACLREVQRHSAGRRSLASLEDPIEAVIEGVAQSHVTSRGEFNLAAGLRSLMRQDPEVIAVGEMRDHATAEGALGAALTGHLLITTFHAGSAAGALSRLLDMGLEPYILRSGLLAVVAQRLVRRLCEECAAEETDPHALLGLTVARAKRAVGCARCGGTGYRGRVPLAELLTLDAADVARAILERADVSRIAQAATQAGMISLEQRGCQAVEAGFTTPIELRRVLGFGNRSARDAAINPLPD
jgi:type II secretory ATPase GspE/PulE/Tfp pilus assembly ATPase PilB-like protein